MDRDIAEIFEKLKALYTAQTEKILSADTIQEFCNFLDGLKNIHISEITRLNTLIETRNQKIDNLMGMIDIYEKAIMTAAESVFDFFGEQDIPERFHALVAYAVKIEELRQSRQGY